MSIIRPDSRQIKKRQALSKLGTSVNSTVETVLDKINVEVDTPLRAAASVIPDTVLNFSPSQILTADGAKKTAATVLNSIVVLTAQTINFQTQSVSSDITIAFPGVNTVGQYRRCAFTLNVSGKIEAIFSAEAVSVAALANAGTLFVNGRSLGYIDLRCTDTLGYFKTANSITNIIENADIYRIQQADEVGTTVVTFIEPEIQFGINYQQLIQTHTTVKSNLYIQGPITINTGSTFTVATGTTFNVI